MGTAAGSPCLVIVGGINGSGKSTFASAPGSEELLLGQSALNPDSFTQVALGEFSDLGQRAANLVGVERAEKALWKALAKREDAAIETVLSTQKFLDAVDVARAVGYRTRLIFVALPNVELAISRVQARVKQGGHDVPADKIRDRWGRAYDNLFVFIEHVDEAIIVSNARLNDILIVAEWDRASGEMRVHHENELPEFMRRLRKHQ